MIRIKNWQKFQHFKDRDPPWIKLYRDLLDDPDWHDLSGDDAKALIMLWLMADKEGTLPSCRKIAFRLRVTEAKLNQQLNRLSHWLEQDDINTISDRYQVDAPETETETETETERIRAVANATSTNESEGAFEEFKRAYPKRKGAMGWQLAKRHFLKAIKAGENPRAIIAGARGYAAAESENVGTPFIKQASAWMNQECWKDYAETARKPQNTLSYEELKAQWLAKQGNVNAERTELGTAASVVETKFRDCKSERDLGRNQTRFPRIQRMDEVLSRGNGKTAGFHDVGETRQQGSDASEPMAEPDRNAADEAENGVEVNSEREIGNQ